MKFLTFLSIGLLFISCASTKNMENKHKTNSETAIVAEIGSVKDMEEIESAPFEIDSVSIEGNFMTMYVKYGGGCQEHDFRFIGSPMISKSLPPIRAVKIYHNSNNDMCKSIVSKTLKIDLSALAYQQENGSEIYLTLENWSENLLYKFQK